MDDVLLAQACVTAVAFFFLTRIFIDDKRAYIWFPLWFLTCVVVNLIGIIYG